MRILVTGCSGFIGFNLSKKLCNLNFDVIGIDNLNQYYDINLKKKRLALLKKYKNFNFKKIDLVNEKSLQNIFKKKIDVVFNLAAQAGVRYSIENPRNYLDSNLIGYFNLLDISRINNVKYFFYASTSSVYGNSKFNKLSELHSVEKPIQFYAATKKSNELMAHSYTKIYGMNTIGLRFFTVYGPWGRPDMALFKFTRSIIENKKIEIFNYGNHMRDFTFIDDAVNIVVNILQYYVKKKKKSIYEIYNVGTNQPVKLKKFIKIIEKKLGKISKKKFLKLQKGDVKTTTCDTSKISKFLPKKLTSLDNGIEKFLSWYKKHY
jgi:UDP-glucuronate 4-epimerase